MYAMVCTWPDIAHTMSIINRYMTNPGKQHWHALKWILLTLQGMKDVGLVYQRSETSHIYGYVSSDYAGVLNKRRSTMGCLYIG